VHRGSVEQAHQTEMARVVGHDGKRVNCNNNTQQGHDADSSVQKVNETETLPPQDTEKHRQAEAMATRLVGAVHEVRVKKREKKAEQQRAKKKQPHEKKTKKRKKSDASKATTKSVTCKALATTNKKTNKRDGKGATGKGGGKKNATNTLETKRMSCTATSENKNCTHETGYGDVHFRDEENAFYSNTQGHFLFGKSCKVCSAMFSEIPQGNKFKAWYCVRAREDEHACDVLLCNNCRGKIGANKRRRFRTSKEIQS
jgi:hypothetical protein